MEAQAADGRIKLTVAEALSLRHEDHRVSSYEVSPAHADPDFLAWLYVAIPDVTRVAIAYDDNDDAEFLFATADRSWAVGIHRPAGRDVVEQGGSRDLWRSVREAFARWVQAGRPGPERLGLTVGIGGDHAVWVDEPGKDEWLLR
jgi:protein-L-isoaspartate(D-aspartate) O-methyltransferase